MIYFPPHGFKKPSRGKLLGLEQTNLLGLPHPLHTARLFGDHQVHVRNVAPVVGMDDGASQFAADTGNGG